MIWLRLSLLALVCSCGDGGTDYEYRTPKTPEKPVPQKPKPTPPEGEETPPVIVEGPSAKELQAIALAAVVKNCSTCHGGSQSPPLTNEGEILGKADRICVRVGGGTMPPGGGIDATDKADILKGLGC